MFKPTNVYNVQPMELLNKLCEIPPNLASPTLFMNKSFSNIKYQTIKGGDNCQRCFQKGLNSNMKLKM